MSLVAMEKSYAMISPELLTLRSPKEVFEKMFRSINSPRAITKACAVPVNFDGFSHPTTCPRSLTPVARE